ncbi:MAG: hypothetical protein KY429_10765 [Actinobacteria bacterium]|nr:hypothetical protein [Actinomycetota bacterium]
MREELLDRWLPQWDFHEYHSVEIDAPPKVVYEQLKLLDLSNLLLTRILFGLRGIPALVRRRRVRLPLKLTLQGLVDAGFVVLDEQGSREIVLGLVGRPWIPSGDIRRVTPAGFEQCEDESLVKMAWNFLVEPRGASACLLSTETRILALGERAKRNFRRYWRLIEPFSGAIRIEALWAVKRQVESMRSSSYR